jgi:hypothetical protein
METYIDRQNQIPKESREKKLFKNTKTIHNIISIIIISSWIFLAGIICYIIIYDYGLNKPEISSTELHWNIAIALFIIILAFSFFLQTILIETENKNDLRSKINHALNHEHRGYFKRKRQVKSNSYYSKSENDNQIEENEKKLNDIINHFGEENNHFLYQLYRQIQNLLIGSKEKQQMPSGTNGELQSKKDLQLNNAEIRSNIIRELTEFHIPDNILNYFIDKKIKHDGLALNSYILPLSFFLFIYFAGFLIILPLINSIFVSDSNQAVIPLFSIFSNETNANSNGTKTGIPLLIIQWGFLGGLVYTSISLLNRFLRKDLPPRVYYNASFRLLLSGAAAVIVFFIYKTFGYSEHDNEITITSSVLLLCFSLGIAPIQFLIRSSDVVLSKFMKFWRHKDTAGKRSLTNIEGIDSITAERLSEEGLDYIQQLALCDPIDLSFKTKFPLHIVKDWKDQALLYLLTADIIVTKKDEIKSQNKQHLNYVLNEVYGIRRFSQFYNLAINFFKKDVHNEEKNKNNNVEKNLQDFCKGLGFTDSDEFKFRYIIESITKTGYSISELYHKYEQKQFSYE